MARNFKVGDVVTSQIIGNTNPMKRSHAPAIITKIENDRIYFQFRQNKNQEQSVPESFAKLGALSKSKNQNEIKKKLGWL